MFDDFEELQPMKEAAQILAEKSDWPDLYDLDALKKNKVPIAAACYYDDMCAHPPPPPLQLSEASLPARE